MNEPLQWHWDVAKEILALLHSMPSGFIPAGQDIASLIAANDPVGDSRCIDMIEAGHVITDLRSQVEALRQENERLHFEVDRADTRAKNDTKALRGELAESTMQRTALRAALEKYGRHLDDCAEWFPAGRAKELGCTCDLATALSATKEAT